MLDNLIEVLQPLTLSERSSENAAQNPVELVASLGQLREIVQNNTTSQLTPGEVTEIGDFSMQLLGSTSAILQRMNNVELQQQNGLLAVSMALWTSANGGQINMLEPLVDTLAWLANRLISQEKTLQGGQVVLTGTMVDPVWLEGDALQAAIEVEGLGRVTAYLT